MSDNFDFLKAQKTKIESKHGWVTPLPGGMVARCGGPAVCSDCQAEYTALSDSQKAAFAHSHPEDLISIQRAEQQRAAHRIQFPVIAPKTGEVAA